MNTPTSLPAPAGPPESAPTPIAYERSPVDALRLGIGTALLAGLIVIGLLFGDTVAGFLSDLLRGLDALPTWILATVVIGARLLATLLFVAGLVAAIRFRRWRLLAVAAAAFVAASAVMDLISPAVDDTSAALVTGIPNLGTGEGYPTAIGLAAVTAVVTTAMPWLTRRWWHRLAWALVIASCIARFVVAPVSLETAAAVVVGWVVGSLCLVLTGGPVRRATTAQVKASLGAVGLPLATFDKAKVDARGSTPFLGTLTDGTAIFAKALGSDERSADLLFRAYRRVVPHDLHDEKSFSTLRRMVEHEAFVALFARDLGVRTPRVRAFARVGDDGFVLAYDGIDGTSLDRLDVGHFDDALLAAIWEQIARLRHHRIAHRDLRLANLFRGADGELWLIDFGFSELAASDALLANDLAEVLASLTMVVGPDRAVRSGIDAVGAELATAVEGLKPFRLSGASRTAMRGRPGLLDELRSKVLATGVR